VKLLEEAEQAAASKKKAQQLPRVQYAISYEYIQLVLQIIIRKYGLCVPYCLEKKLKVVELSYLKLYPELPLLDYLMVQGTFTANLLPNISTELIRCSYAFSSLKPDLPYGEEE